MAHNTFTTHHICWNQAALMVFDRHGLKHTVGRPQENNIIFWLLFCPVPQNPAVRTFVTSSRRIIGFLASDGLCGGQLPRPGLRSCGVERNMRRGSAPRSALLMMAPEFHRWPLSNSRSPSLTQASHCWLQLPSLPTSLEAPAPPHSPMPIPFGASQSRRPADCGNIGTSTWLGRTRAPEQGKVRVFARASRSAHR